MIKVLNVPSHYSALYKTVDFCKERVNETIEIIVPDKLSLFMEKFLFEHINITSSFNLKVSTFNRFAKKSIAVDKEKQISKVGSILLIHKILNENIDKLEILKNKSYSFTYAEDIFKTIGQLKASKITFEEMKVFSSNDARLSGKIKDLALVYEKYETQKAGLLDASDMFLMSTMYIGNDRVNNTLLFVGFDDFTAIEYSIIERLSINNQVNVLNYSSKAKNKFIYNSEIISQLRNIAYTNQLPFEVEDFYIEKSKLKQFLEENLFALSTNQFTLENDIVKVYSGNNVLDEIEFIARDIRKKILEGARYDDFGVGLFGLETQTNKIKEIFEKYEINYYIDSEISINKSILYKFFVSILKYNLDGYNLCNLIDIINSPFFELKKQEKQKIIIKLIERNYRGRVYKNLVFDVDDEIKTKFIEFCDLITFDKDINVAEMVEKLKSLDTVLNFDNTLENLTNDVSQKTLLRKSKNVIFSLFDDILKFDNQDVNSFYDVFIHVSSVVKINNLPLSLDAVKVVDANNSMEIFKDFYLVGANHENAPMLKHDCGIILDNEIEKLNFSHKLNPTISHINKMAKLRLFNSSLLFENELVVTYSNTQSDLVKELLNKIQIETVKGKINIVPISRFDYDKYVCLSYWDYIEQDCKNKINNKKSENYSKNCEKIIKNKEFLQLNKENLKIFNDFNSVSATTLENYFKCPLYAFLNNILKIKPRMETEILSLDIGNVLHEIMFKYYKLKKQVGDIYEFCKAEVLRCVEREERLKLNANSPILINLIDEAVRVINALNYIDENSSFVPTYFEYDFKNETALKLKNISIIGKVDRIDVVGDMFRIIDYKSGKADAALKELFYGNKLQLFLYSCAMENVLKKSGVGTFYLPLHNAYTRELTNIYSLKGFYLAEDFVVKSFDKRLVAGMKSDIVNVKLNKDESISKMRGNKELNSKEMSRLKNYSKLVSEKAVEELKSGYIAPSPSGLGKPCEYCPYVHVCLRSSSNVEFRPTNKVDLDSFKEVENENI